MNGGFVFHDEGALPINFALLKLTLILEVVPVIVPNKNSIVRMLHSLFEIPDVPVAIGVSLNALSMGDVFTPTALIHDIIIGELTLSRNAICVNISHKVRPISVDEIIFLPVAIAIHKNAYQDRSIRKDGDTLPMRLVVFPFSMVASIVNAKFKETLELLDIVISLLSILDIQILVIAKLLYKSLVGLIRLWCELVGAALA